MVEREPAFLRDGDAPSEVPKREDDTTSPAEALREHDTEERTAAPAPPHTAPTDAARERPTQPKRRDKDDARRAAAERRGAPVFYAAGLFRRLAAAIIDLAIIIPASLIAGTMAGWIGGVHLPKSRHHGIDFWLDLVLANDPALVGGLGLALAIALVYAFVFQLTMSRTLGMRALKLRVIDTYGDAPTPSRIIGRTAGYLGCVATLFLGFLWIGFDAEKRGLHDWVSGTHVVRD